MSNSTFSETIKERKRKDMLYKVGDTVRYKTSSIRTIHHGETLGTVKEGVIEEAFSTLDKRPCYWIRGEKELIFGSQIIGGLT